MKIKELSNRLNMSVYTIRYYEKIGILKPKRNDNKYREYSEEDVFNLMFIQVLQYAHFELKEIKVIVKSFYLPPSEECNTQVNELFEKKAKELHQKIDNYTKINKLFSEIPLAENATIYVKYMNDFKLKTQSLILEVFNNIERENL